MSFWIYIAAICVVSAVIASRMNVVTNEELNENPWQKESM